MIARQIPLSSGRNHAPRSKSTAKPPNSSPNPHQTLDAKPAAAAAGARSEMAGKSKRTTAPAPPEFPRPATQPVQSPTAQLAPPPAVPSMFGPGTRLPPRPPQSMAASSPLCWVAGVRPPPMAGSSAQLPWWTPSAGIGGPVYAAPTHDDLEDYDLQAWVVAMVM